MATKCLNSKINGKQPSLQDRIYCDSGNATAITTSFHPWIKESEIEHKGITLYDFLDPQNGFKVDKDLYLSEKMKKYILTSSQGANRKNEINSSTLNRDTALAITTANNKRCHTTSYMVDGQPQNVRARHLINDVDQDMSHLKIRKLSNRECFRLMGLTDKKIGAKVMLEKLLDSESKIVTDVELKKVFENYKKYNLRMSTKSDLQYKEKYWLLPGKQEHNKDTDSQLRRIFKPDCVIGTIFTSPYFVCRYESPNYVLYNELSPTESFRLMGLGGGADEFDDTQINRLINSGITKSKLHVLAGNSIVIPVLEHIIKEYMDLPKDKPVKLMEFFSGYGSQHQALKNLGYKVDAHISEWFTEAIIGYTYLHHPHMMDNYDNGRCVISHHQPNFKDMTFSTDSKEPAKDITKYKHYEKLRIANSLSHNKGSIVDIKGGSLDQYDLVTYSFPCQDLSIAGKKAGMSKDANTRSGLLWEFERIIKELKVENKLPKYLLMENVPQIHSKQNMFVFQDWINSLRKIGYDNKWFDLNARDFGIPQNRNRTFMVSTLKDNPDEPVVNNLFELLEE